MRHPPLRNPYRVLLLLSQLSHPESPRLSKIDILVGAGPRPARRTEFDSKREKTEGEDREGKRELELASFNREGSSPPPTILPLLPCPFRVSTHASTTPEFLLLSRSIGNRADVFATPLLNVLRLRNVSFASVHYFYFLAKFHHLTNKIISPLKVPLKSVGIFESSYLRKGEKRAHRHEYRLKYNPTRYTICKPLLRTNDREIDPFPGIFPPSVSRNRGIAESSR